MMNAAKKPILAVIPTDPIEFYLESGYSAKWLRSYFNPCGMFEKVYILSPDVRDNPDILGFHSIRTKPEELRQRIQSLGVDLVRAYGGFWPCDMACNSKFPGVPVIVSVHDTSPRLLNDSIRKADVVFCVSEAVRKLVLTKFKKPERVWSFTNRVDFKTMHPFLKSEVEDLDRSYAFKYRILHVGRKTEQKNLETLIRALKILGEAYGLLAVGKGDASFYAQLAKAEGVAERCFFIDAIANDELARYYSWADCLCMPSRWEGFCMVLIEALACEAVIVASEIPELAEIVKHGRNGLLVKDYENPQAFADAIRAVCEDSRLRESLKAAARKSVERHQKEKVDALEVEYYQKAMQLGPNVRSFPKKFIDYTKYRLSQATRKIS